MWEFFTNPYINHLSVIQTEVSSTLWLLLSFSLWFILMTRTLWGSVFLFVGQPHGIWSSPARDQIQAVLQLKLQLQQSLTHWARPGIEPVSQCSQDATDAIAPQGELPELFVLM